MSQIVSYTKKLQLLEKTNEIDEEERERNMKNLAERNEKYKKLKSKNDLQCVRSSNEVDLRQESAERKHLLQQLKDSISDMPWMQPMVDLLEKNQGK